MRTYPGSLGEAVGNAVEEGMAEVEHPVLLQATHLVHELACLVGAHLCSSFSPVLAKAMVILRNILGASYSSSV